MQKFNTQKRKQFGQGMMEYIIIVALIAVSAIGVYAMFGKSIRNQTAGLATEIAGKDAKTQIDNSVKSAGESSTRGNADKGMGSYNDKNDQK